MSRWTTLGERESSGGPTQANLRGGRLAQDCSGVTPLKVEVGDRFEELSHEVPREGERQGIAPILVVWHEAAAVDVLGDHVELVRRRVVNDCERGGAALRATV